MPEITTPHGKTFEETNTVAVAYYHREPGYTVDGEDRTAESAPSPVSTAKSLKIDPPAPPPPAN